MRIPTLIAWAAGVALLAGLIAFNGAARLLDTVAALGWWLVPVIAYHGVPLSIDTRAWQILFTRRPRFLALLRTLWISEGINGLFPVPHLGELLRARIAWRMTGTGEGVATVVVDLTLAITTEAMFALIGLALFSAVPGTGGTVRILLPAMAAIGASALAFYFLQRAGLFTLASRILHRWSETARRGFGLAGAAALDAALGDLYRHRDAVIASALWRLGGWIAGAGETWLVFYALGHPIGVAEAIIVESLSHAARTAAFFIPGGLGFQDGALMLLGSALGLGPDAGLVLALTKRLRELVLGLPGLATGYVLEARQLIGQMAEARNATPGERSSLETHS
jgi:putative membrane protein